MHPLFIPFWLVSIPLRFAGLWRVMIQLLPPTEYHCPDDDALLRFE